MVRFWMVFDEEKAKAQGLDCNALRSLTEEYLSVFPGIKKTGKCEWRGPFPKAMDLFGDLSNLICQSDGVFDSLTSMGWDVNGRVENILEGEHWWRELHADQETLWHKPGAELYIKTLRTRIEIAKEFFKKIKIHRILEKFERSNNKREGKK